MKPWTLAASIVASVLFVAALSNGFYELTSPASLSWHVVLRKGYSIAAFTLVGYLSRRALIEHGRHAVVVPCIIGVAAYSALIEAGQALLGAREGLGWNAIDVVCGAAGGFFAVIDRFWALRFWAQTRDRTGQR